MGSSSHGLMCCNNRQCRDTEIREMKVGRAAHEKSDDVPPAAGF